ncbi:MAG TPA: 50S ribosomal protein L22 [Acidimicrobiales bacterium]|nr:50S ribosomal protein L22 [Acidimicrobiales bacterium]
MSTKTNEHPGTRAVLRHCNMSSYKVREVLDLVRGMDCVRAAEVLEHTERAAAPVVLKLLKSAAANAEHNDGLDSSEMYIATAFADEGATLKRWRPRARGRATRIRKRSCHITLILTRMPDEQILRRRARAAANAAEMRARRVAGARRGRKRSQETINEGEASSAFDETSVQPDGQTEDSGEIEPTDVPDVEAVGDDQDVQDVQDDEIVNDGVEQVKGESPEAATGEISPEEESN